MGAERPLPPLPDLEWTLLPAPHVFVPFGGGYRKCIGFAMATLETKTVIAELFRTTQLALEPRRVKPTGYSAMRPHPGVFAHAAPLGARVAASG